MPVKPVEVKRVALNCLIAPETKIAIDRVRKAGIESAGQVIDRAIALLVGGFPALNPPVEECAPPPERIEVDVKTKKPGIAPEVARMHVPSWKREPRQKGDPKR